MSLLGKWSSQGKARDGKRGAGRGQQRSVSAPAVLTMDLAPKKRKQWRDKRHACSHSCSSAQAIEDT